VQAERLALVVRRGVALTGRLLDRAQLVEHVGLAKPVTKIAVQLKRAPEIGSRLTVVSSRPDRFAGSNGGPLMLLPVGGPNDSVA
jgi:hypothetical protein